MNLYHLNLGVYLNIYISTYYVDCVASLAMEEYPVSGNLKENLHHVKQRM